MDSVERPTAAAPRPRSGADETTATDDRPEAQRPAGPDRVAPPLVRLLRETAWTHRRAYAAALALMAIVAAMGGAVALAVEQVTDEVFFNRNAELLGPIAGGVALVFLVRGAAMYGQTVILQRVGNRIVAELQSRLHSHVLAQGLAFHATTDSGDLATRMSHNALAARQALHLLATRLGVDLLSVLVLAGVMLYQDWQMTLVVLLGLPPILGGVAALVGRVRRAARAEIVLYSRIMALMTETATGARVIKAFGLEPIMAARMGAAIEGVRGRADRIAVLQGLVNPIMETTAGIAAAAVILYGGWRVTAEGLAVGTFFSFLTALMMAGDPARRLAQLHVTLKRHLAGIEAIYAVLDSRTGPEDRPDATPLAPGPGEIRLEGVSFTYPSVSPGAPAAPAGARETGAALRDLTLRAAAGEVTALVGPSGAGKSSVLALIERFYDPDSGRVTLDGQDLRDVTRESLRARIAHVGQETFLFDATVAENIRYGRPGASRTEIEAAARDANADAFIRALPEGYDTPLGEGGIRLSGGQRQRIAIARAMLRDAPILLLDEATSALDAETEARVQEALGRLMAGRTTLVIAHRLATVRRAHQILVMEAGRLVEAGPHDRLSRQGGLYARLAALQFGAPPEKPEADAPGPTTRDPDPPPAPGHPEDRA
ncbi:MAG: ABC transporter ATP-binding protein [Paracoccaceae bacterium]